MSIYSGFAVRKQEEKYNLLVTKLIGLLQQHVVESMSRIKSQKRETFGSGFQFEEKKIAQYRLVLDKMQQLEEHKYLQPKYSQSCQELFEFIEEFWQKSQTQASFRTKKSFSTDSAKSKFVLYNQTINKIYEGDRMCFNKSQKDFRKSIDNRATIQSQKKRMKPKKSSFCAKNASINKSSSALDFNEFSQQRSSSTIDQINLSKVISQKQLIKLQKGDDQRYKPRIYKSEDKETNQAKLQPNVMQNKAQESKVISQKPADKPIDKNFSDFSKSRLLQKIDEQIFQQEETEQQTDNNSEKHTFSFKLMQTISNGVVIDGNEKQRKALTRYKPTGYKRAIDRTHIKRFVIQTK